MIGERQVRKTGNDVNEARWQSEIAGRREWIAAVLIPASLLCGLNIAKPLVVDDTAYHAFALQIACSPLDPYGFDIYWYEHPQPAFTVLAPPVLPFWWAASIRLFGDEPWIAKLWLLPWCLALSAATYSLAKRFAPSIAVATTWMVVLSPSILPSLNLMLDVPATALSLSALAVFFRGSLASAAAAGLLAGLAMQTKYSAFVVPLELVLAGLTCRNWRDGIARAAITSTIAASIFAGWELYVSDKYGHSHFLYHSAHQPQGWLRRDGLISPLIGLMGSVAAPLVLLRLATRGYSWTWMLVFAGSIAGGISAVAIWPRHEGTLWTPTAVVFGVLGVTVAISILASIRDHSRELRSGPNSRFLAGWLAIELIGYFALTPWPAVRRVLGIAIVSTLVVAGTSQATRFDRRKVWFAVVCSIALALLYQAIEIENGTIERDAVSTIDARIRQVDSQPRVWFTGHRGWQFFAERAGWQALDFRQSQLLRPGDWLVVPDSEFTGHRIQLPENSEEIETIEFQSRWRLGTIPWFYGTNAAIRRRDGPVLTAAIDRIR